MRMDEILLPCSILGVSLGAFQRGNLAVRIVDRVTIGQMTADGQWGCYGVEVVASGQWCGY